MPRIPITMRNLSGLPRTDSQPWNQINISEAHDALQMFAQIRIDPSIFQGQAPSPSVPEVEDMPLNDFSYRVIASANRTGFVMMPPVMNHSQHIAVPYDNIDDAYNEAFELAAVTRARTGDERYNVYPRRNSVAYTTLLRSITAPNHTGVPNFTAFCTMLRSAVKYERKQDDEADSVRLMQFADFRRSEGRRTFGVDKNTADVLQNMFAMISGRPYTRIHGETGLIPEAYTVSVHTTGDRTSSCVRFRAGGRNGVVECSHCHENFMNDHTRRVSIQGTAPRICTTCSTELGYFRCTVCGNHHRAVDQCETLQNLSPSHVFDYSQNVLGIFNNLVKTDKDKLVNGKNLFYGVELEVLPRPEFTRQAAATACNAALKGFGILKNDSSLGPTGFEIVTVPATLAAHRTLVWSKFFNVGAGKIPASKTVYSWDTLKNTGFGCGIHVHISKDAMTAMQISKLLVFYNEDFNSAFLGRIAGRKVGPDARYCMARKKKLDIHTQSKCTGHHDAITVSRRNTGKTIEVRIFRGNATYHGLMRCIEFVDATVAWCAVNSSSDILNFNKFIEWFSKPSIRSQYPELRKNLIHLKYIQPRVVSDKFKSLVQEDMPTELRQA